MRSHKRVALASVVAHMSNVNDEVPVVNNEICILLTAYGASYVYRVAKGGLFFHQVYQRR